jgi:hypothetical protein
MAVQVDPIKPTLKAPGTKRLKLTYDQLLATFAFKFNLRRYSQVPRPRPLRALLRKAVPARGLGGTAPRGVCRVAAGAAGCRHRGLSRGRAAMRQCQCLRM